MGFIVAFCCSLVASSWFLVFAVFDLSIIEAVGLGLF